MKLAILSDTHDNIWALRGALALMADADVVLHCGDLCSPFMLKQLGEGLGGRPLHLVWGNNNGDPLLLQSIAAQFDHLTLHGELAELELDGVRIAVNHYPGIARGLAASGLYDLVCFGHSHQAHEARVGNCLLLNPGELMGLYGRRTFAFYDTQTRAAQLMSVTESGR